MTAAQAGDSLLRLHGEQKQAEEALVHQSEALRRRETSEHELLESSLAFERMLKKRRINWKRLPRN